MKKIILLLISSVFCLILFGCGSDSGGALTMTALTSTDNGNGTYHVSTTVTYVPPSGKSAQGVKVTIDSIEHEFTSGSNSVNYSIDVPQLVTAYTVSIVASIGDMTASSTTVIPKTP